MTAARRLLHLPAYLGVGLVLAGWRLLRCNPWSLGGVDHACDQRLFRHAHRHTRTTP